jgi:hypothetical protein
MRKTSLRIKIIRSLFLLLLFIPTPSCSQGQNSWPISPMGVQHPIGNSFGEFQNFGSCLDERGFLMEYCVFLHSGIDILGEPAYSLSGGANPSASQVVVSAGGVVVAIAKDEGSDINYVAIRDANGVVYRYVHLEYDTYESSIVLGNNIPAGTPIAKLFKWDECDYHHLHYEIEEGGLYINPLAGITPHVDSEPPQVGSISFARDDNAGNSDPWDQLAEVDPKGCTVVRGKVDIIARIHDRDSAGSNHPGTRTLWVRNVRWRACPESNPNCSWNDTCSFDTMPTEWHDTKNNAATLAYFSVTDPWQSSSDYCQRTDLYAIVTNSKSDANGMPKPDQAGSWDTRTVPDGNYFVSVEAKDFAGNTSSPMTTCVLVNNGASSDGIPPTSPKGFRIR